ncbi:MAG TPA: hypothetical protein VFK06_00090 [Candidatus Angelobacter sp.]|nr:hypothetical protein [Candidatus Angelobacter sp.]
MNMNWKNAMIYGSLAAGAILFLTGRRPAGIAVAGVGVATLVAENPDKFTELWNRLPEYVDKGTRLIDAAATIMERMGQHRAESYRNTPMASGNRY